MRTLTFTISGPPDLVGSALQRLNAASRIARLTARDEGEVAIDVLGHGLQTKKSNPIEFEMGGIDNPTTSVVIRLPNVIEPTYFVIEDADMALNEDGAAAVVQALHSGAFNERDGFVFGTTDLEVFAPTPSNVQDRCVLRDAMGKKITEVSLPTANGKDRLTAAITFDGERRGSPALLIGVQGDGTVYRISPFDLMKVADGNETVELSKEHGIELPDAIRRIRRADKSGFAAIELEDGKVLYFRSTGRGAAALAQKPTMAVDDDTIRDGWEGFGFSKAVTDKSGQSACGFVKPQDGSVAFRFVPEERRGKEAGAK